MWQGRQLRSPSGARSLPPEPDQKTMRDPLIYKLAQWPSRLFLVGYLAPNLPDGAFAVVGIFRSERMADEACKDEDYFIGPLNLDTINHGEDWEGLYFPRRLPSATKGDPCRTVRKFPFVEGHPAAPVHSVPQ